MKNKTLITLFAVAGLALALWLSGFHVIYYGSHMGAGLFVGWFDSPLFVTLPL